MRGIFKWGGIAASVILIAFGIGSIGAGVFGIHYTRDQLKLEQITGTPDMTPSAIKTEAQQAGLTNVDLPTCSVAGEKVDTGKEAKCFASYMRIHTLEASGGQTYAQMGQYLDANGNRRRIRRRRPRIRRPGSRSRIKRVTSGSPIPRSRPRSTRRFSRRPWACSGS